MRRTLELPALRLVRRRLARGRCHLDRSGVCTPLPKRGVVLRSSELSWVWRSSQIGGKVSVASFALTAPGGDLQRGFHGVPPFFRLAVRASFPLLVPHR